MGTTPTIDDLRAIWGARSGLVHYGPNLAAVNLIADGTPATPQALAAATEMGLDEAEGYVSAAPAWGIEVADGAIVGASLTMRPTQHQFRVRNNDLYTWCGFDALFLPTMLGDQAQVTSTCPVTSTEIRLTIDPDGTVPDATPTSVAVGIVGEKIISSCAVSGPESEICTQMPLFASREAGERWQADHPGVAIVDLDDAYEIAQAHATAG